MAFDIDLHPDDYWGSALLLDRPKASRQIHSTGVIAGSAAMTGLRHPDDEWIPVEPGPQLDTDPAALALDDSPAAQVEARTFEKAAKRLNDLIDSIVALLSSPAAPNQSTDAGELDQRHDAEGKAIDAWLFEAQKSLLTRSPISREGSSASSQTLAGLFGDLLPETSSDAHAGMMNGAHGASDLDPFEWRARERAGEWVHELPIFKASEIGPAVDRLARLLITHRTGAAHTRIRALISEGLTLSEIEDAATLKTFFDDEAKLCLMRRFDRQQRCWTTYQSSSGLSWKLAARLLSIASLERLQEVLEISWKDEWLDLPTQLSGWDAELSQAFRSYLRYVAIRKHVKRVVKANQSQFRDPAGDTYDHLSDEPSFKASLPSATTSDSAMRLAPTTVWVSNDRPARPI